MDRIENKIVHKLREVETAHDVRILWAVETGSRTWGFASPDSDYDARFIYARKPEWYLGVKEGRDVIELPIEDELDINGWDLRKALRLLIKFNPTLLEWLVSPYVYMRSGSFVKKAQSLAEQYFSPKPVAYHYTRMAQNNFSAYIENREQIILKKYLYVIRPLINVLWLHRHNRMIPISMLETLRGIVDLSFDSPGLMPEAAAAIENLVAKKRSSPELGRGDRIPAIDAFIRESIKLAEQYCGASGKNRIPLDEVNRVFRNILEESRV